MHATTHLILALSVGVNNATPADCGGWGYRGRITEVQCQSIDSMTILCWNLPDVYDLLSIFRPYMHIIRRFFHSG